MVRCLQHAPAHVTVPEPSFHPAPLTSLMVFYGRPLPASARNAQAIADDWIAAAQAQLTSAPLGVLASALRHALGFGAEAPDDRAPPPEAAHDRTVLLGSSDPAVAHALTRAGFSVRPIVFTPFDAEAASKIAYFETYNRTAASQRVADIVSAVRQSPSAALVADGDAALAALLAEAVVPIRRAG